jgi:transcriptional regulator with XRE-family HTH domain
MDLDGTGVLVTVGRIVRGRRKERSQTMGGLARELVIGTDELSAIEHDEHPLGEAHIRVLARALDLDEGLLHSREGLIAKLRALRVAAPVHSDRPAVPDDPFFEGRRARSARYRRDIETVAAEMRKTMPVPPQGKISALSFFERLDELTFPVRGEQYRVDYAVRRLAHRVEARTHADVASRTIEIAVSPEAYREMTRGNPRSLFTLCHEVGHVVLHREELVTPDEPSESDAAVHPCSSTEWQAQAFAAAFISPLEQVLALHDQIGSLSPVDVHRTFGCSKVAAQRRLEAVERLLPGRIVKFDDQMLFPFGDRV